MRLFTNGALNVICRPPLHAGEANAVKSPASIAAVGTNAMLSDGSWRIVRALVSGEEEQLVLHDRPADRAAELVALDRVALGRKRIPRIEDSIPHEFEQIAMKLVRSRFRHQADCAGGFHAVLAPTALVSTLNSCIASGNGIDMYPLSNGLL